MEEATFKNRIIAEIKDACKEYQTGDTLITALKPTTIQFKTGELTLIIGPSGSGKTTLLSLLGCVIYPTKGDVFIDGQQVNTLSSKELSILRLNKIGFVFQGFNLLAPLNSLENVMMPLQLMHLSDSEAKKKAEKALELVGMKDRMKNLPKMLSGGQQQRVAIARALVTNPPIMLCDEPTAALDVKSVGLVMNELKALAQNGKSVIVVTHDMRLKEFADRIIYVDNGIATEKENPAFIENH
ncbi:ABC transporter ATP-binding protein [Flavobacterium hydatis]|uniref:Macrolide ABC transporter ATP-binding protein n=1 Tax=Flavobacterium hydatis TaxID=991 RepID=A0A086AIJ7_FLAHY|nr:ABC transporter ATP-binding protein [Flavobacterium hydatis]KFF16511.1 macrolide ABC transporter ATP-binding protein [Flavobacterium hydatis]OXA87722.1 macrolide ABC transporter ATP-binding protein [Flavobacterium hydatis]